MSIEMAIIVATALYVVTPILLGEILDRIFRASWYIIRKYALDNLQR